MKKIPLQNTIAAILALAAIVFLFATYGTTLPSAPFASIALNGPTAADSNGELTAIVDTESRRVLVLNDDGDLTGEVDCTTFNSPIDAVSNVCVSQKFIYVAGVKYAPDSSAIEKERIAIYDKGGNFQGIYYELVRKDSDSVQMYSNIPSIVSICSVPDGVIAVLRGYAKSSNGQSVQSEITLVHVTLDASEEVEKRELGGSEIYKAGYSAESNVLAHMSMRGMINDDDFEKPVIFPDHVFADIGISSDGHTVYACDDLSGALCAITNGAISELVAGDGYDSVHVNGEFITLTERDKNMVKLCDSSGQVKLELTSVTPSSGFSIRMVFVWLSVFYLVALALVLAARKIRAAIAKGRADILGPVFASVAVVAAVGATVFFLSQSTYQSSFKTRADEIGLCADYLGENAQELTDTMQRCDDREAIRSSGDSLINFVSDLSSLSSQVNSLVDAAAQNNIGMYYAIYAKDDKGIFYLVDSELEHVLSSSVDSSVESMLAPQFDGPYKQDPELHTGRTVRDSTLFRYVQIPSKDGGVAGVIEIGSRIRSLESSLTTNLVQKTLGLLVIMLVAFLAYSELRACARCLFSYQKLQRNRAPDAVATLTRPFTFVITILSSIDSVMTVLIARELLSNSGLGDTGALVAIPAVMLGVGLIVGQVLYGLMGSHVGMRRLVGVGTCVLLLCALGTIATVWLGSFVLYCVAKLALSIPLGLLYTLGYSLPRFAESDATRTSAAGGVRRTDTSAAALGTVLGGYAAQTLGNAWVYVLVAIACLPLIIMTLKLLPKGMGPLEKPKARGEEVRAVLRCMGNRRMLILAFLVVLPATIASGYASFLFPLFSIDLGLEKADVNNIFVLGQLVVYLCISSIERVDARMGKWRITFVSIALIGVVFLLFSLNTTLLWSVAVVAIVGVLCKSSDGWKGLWMQVAGEEDMPAGVATGAMFAARSAALIVRPSLFGALLGATDSIAVIVIGALCMLCAALFYFLTRRSTLARVPK